jgi:hypothetical protein
MTEAQAESMVRVKWRASLLPAESQYTASQLEKFRKPVQSVDDPAVRATQSCQTLPFVTIRVSKAQVRSLRVAFEAGRLGPVGVSTHIPVSPVKDYVAVEAAFQQRRDRSNNITQLLKLYRPPFWPGVRIADAVDLAHLPEQFDFVSLTCY